MLTITTADPNNAQTKLIELPRCPGKSRSKLDIKNDIASARGALVKSLDTAYQVLIDDGIDLNNPHLNVRDAYIRHVEQQNADLKTKITDMQDHLIQADRVIFALLASLLVFAVIAVAMVWR